MSTTIISDKHGNMKKISDKNDSITLVRDMLENRKKISYNRPSGSDLVFSASVNKIRVNIKLMNTIEIFLVFNLMVIISLTTCLESLR